MKCFYHNDKDAVGICKSCKKGLCIDCAVDLGKGLACKNYCEEDVKRLIDISQENIQYASNTSKFLQSKKTGRPNISKLFIVVGIIITLCGILPGMPLFPFFCIGVLFLLYGIISLIRYLKSQKINSEK